MIELILTAIALVAIGAIVWAKDTARSSLDLMVPHNIQKWGQHAANTSQKSQVAVFDGSTYDIVRSDNQHAARGQIVMIFHPEYIQEKPQRIINVGAVLKPNPDIEQVTA